MVPYVSDAIAAEAAAPYSVAVSGEASSTGEAPMHVPLTCGNGISPGGLRVMQFVTERIGRSRRPRGTQVWPARPWNEA